MGGVLTGNQTRVRYLDTHRVSFVGSEKPYCALKVCADSCITKVGLELYGTREDKGVPGSTVRKNEELGTQSEEEGWNGPAVSQLHNAQQRHQTVIKGTPSGKGKGQTTGRESWRDC